MEGFNVINKPTQPFQVKPVVCKSIKNEIYTRVMKDRYSSIYVGVNTNRISVENT